MDLQGILMLVGLGFGAYFITKTGLKVDDRIEERRRLAIQLAQWTSANGLPAVSQLLSSYAVSDYSGVVSQVRSLSDIISNPDTSRDAVTSFLKVQLGKRLDTAEGRAEIIKFVEDRLRVKVKIMEVIQ